MPGAACRVGFGARRLAFGEVSPESVESALSVDEFFFCVLCGSAVVAVFGRGAA